MLTTRVMLKSYQSSDVGKMTKMAAPISYDEKISKLNLSLIKVQVDKLYGRLSRIVAWETIFSLGKFG